MDIFLLLSPLVPCTLLSLGIKNSFLFQKHRYLSSTDNLRALGIQSRYYIFIVKKENIVLYIRRVVLIPFSEKYLQRSAPSNIPPLGPFPQKSSFAAAELFGGRRRGGGASADVGRGAAVVERHFQRRQHCRCRRC
jgi:hypothetical protein